MSIRFSTLHLPMIAAAAVAFGVAPAVHGQQTGTGQQQQQQLQQQQQQVPDFSDQELQQFAEAATDIQEISAQWEPRLQQAETQEEIEQVRQAANEEMVEAIEDNGLSVEKYSEIYMSAQSDPELNERVNQYMSQAQ